MTDQNDEYFPDEPSSCHLLVPLEDLLKRSDQTSRLISKKKYQSKSVDDILLYQQDKQSNNEQILSRTELDLSSFDDNDDQLDDFSNQRSRSVPASLNKIYEKELSAFIDCDQPAQQFPTDNFIFNIDLSNPNESSQSSNSKLAIFFEDDDIAYEPSVNHLYSSMMNNCLTIAEENEDDLEEFTRDDIPENDHIYESPHSSTDIDEKLIVYDIAHFDPPIKSIPDHSLARPSFAPCPNLTAVRTSLLISNPITSLSPFLQATSIEQKQQHSSSSPLSSPMLFPLDDNPIQLPSSSHVIKMKVIQSSLSSLSDFISSIPVTNIENHSSSLHERRPSLILTNGLLLSHCATNPTSRRLPSDPFDSINEQLRTNSSSSSSEIFISSDEKLLSRSDYLLQHQSSLLPQRKSSSLKNILYPIEFSHHPKVPTSDSGILIDQFPIHQDEDHQLERIYEQTLRDLRLIKQHLVEIESRLSEAMRELEIEQALIEGEHDLVFKDILKASEFDQNQLRNLYRNLQLLIEGMAVEKNALRKEIHYTQQTFEKLQREFNELERSSSDKIFLSKKREILIDTRKKYEDLEFQLMEYETRCESEIEQAEKQFQYEQKRLMDNAQHRQKTLHELDQQQYLILSQSTIEKEKLEREKQKLKLFFKQKQIDANELEQQIQRNRFDSRTKDYQVQLRDKNRGQERPLTRYLPICAEDFDLRGHIENAGHRLDSSQVLVNSTSCRGYLQKMGGMKIKTWNRRWFVFDRQSHSLFYYQDKTESKLRGCIPFQSIGEVYVDHFQSISLRSPEPRQATFIVKTIGRSYYLVAPTVEAMRIWVDVIITGAEGNTFARN